MSIPHAACPSRQTTRSSWSAPPLAKFYSLEAPADQEVVVLRKHRQEVSDVGFSGDGSKIYSESKTEKIVWDRQTGLPLPGAPYLETLRFGNISPDSRWLAIPSETDILLVDQHYKNRPEEAARRAESAKVCIGPSRFRRLMKTKTGSRRHSDCSGESKPILNSRASIQIASGFLSTIASSTQRNKKRSADFS